MIYTVVLQADAEQLLKLMLEHEIVNVTECYTEEEKETAAWIKERGNLIINSSVSYIYDMYRADFLNKKTMKKSDFTKVVKATLGCHCKNQWVVDRSIYCFSL